MEGPPIKIASIIVKFPRQERSSPSANLSSKPRVVLHKVAKDSISVLLALGVCKNIPLTCWRIHTLIFTLIPSLCMGFYI